MGLKISYYIEQILMTRRMNDVTKFFILQPLKVGTPSRSTKKMPLVFSPTAFKRQFGLIVSINWLSSKAATTKVPHHPQLLFQGHSCSLHPPVHPGFCRVVGGPVCPRRHAYPLAVPLNPQGGETSVSDSLLHRTSEAVGWNQPLNKGFCSHTGADGLVHVPCSMTIPRMNSSVVGVVRVSPGPTPRANLETARKAAAQQVLPRFHCNHSLSLMP